MTLETKNQIEFKKKTAFGIERLYPACRKALAVCDMLGSRTFVRHNLQYLTVMGFDILITGEESEEIKQGENK